ncbi:glycosyltransferase family 2 protein [Calothrix sp. PCC 6303]|uniref:glycosyltransferase family 2 protein n=1 Tax=Calothrix sp. PCC 6303 TaxID=1170562 RepID=UPI0002A001B0|nr:glycosyltransferase family 2 protein [Calothrix sp. PCC 6303]AFZ03828.1 glycosyl transferase family 2 [Calothrix sp. PCC 6303]
MENYLLIYLLLSIVTFFFVILIGLPILFFFIECIAALLKNTDHINYNNLTRPSVAVIIPAYNEASCIDTTLLRLKHELVPTDKVIVVADNCSDETAAIARQYKVTVLERFDATYRGKGYALDWGLQHLKANPPEVVVFLDADCQVHHDTITHLAQIAIAKNRPIQATNLLKTAEHSTPRDAISSLAFIMKNLVRQRGLHNLGLPATLTGTGMAFPWAIIDQVSFASGNIVEDKQLGLDLAVAGYSPVYCEQALVTGYFPQHQQAGNTQRTRWVHGHLQTLLTQVPAMLLAAWRQKRLDLLAIGLDMAIPPLSLLVSLWLMEVVISLMIFPISSIPAGIASIQGLMLFTAIFGAWNKFAKNDFPARIFLEIPIYILWNLSIYWSFLIKPQRTWIRTQRDIEIS